MMGDLKAFEGSSDYFARRLERETRQFIGLCGMKMQAIPSGNVLKSREHLVDRHLMIALKLTSLRRLFWPDYPNFPGFS